MHFYIMRPSVVLLFFVFLIISSVAYADPASVFSPQEKNWIVEHPVLYVGIDNDNALTQYIKNGKYRDVSSAYLDFIASTTGLKIRLVQYNDPRYARGAIGERKVDVYPIVSSTFKGAMVGGEIIYTLPYYLGLTAVVTRPGADVTHHWEDLKDKKIALKRDAIYATFIKENFPHLQIIEVDSVDDALEAVADGRADATLGLDVVLNKLVRKKFANRLSFAGRIENSPVNIGMGIRRDEPILAAIIEKSLSLVTAKDNEQWINDWQQGMGYGERSLSTLLADYALEISSFLLSFVLVLIFAYQARLARRRAIRSEQQKSMFLAVMSHEIRTPLNAILGNIELLGSLSRPERDHDRLQTIKSSSRILLDVLNDVLDFSKAESNQIVIEKIRFDLVDTIEHIIVMFAPAADAKRLKLCYAVAPTLHRYYQGDQTRIRQIVANLVSNAIKFTEAGSVAIDMRSLHSAAHGLQIIISVTDTGIGIPPNHRQGIFDAFSQADSSITRRFGGTGLGLALCKRMTELMGGRIVVDSEVGSGSTFTVTLPMVSGPDMAPRGKPFTGLPRLSFLCAAPEWQSFIGAQLTQWGLSARLVEDPGELLTETCPLLIFGNPRPWSVAHEDALRRRAAWVIDAIEDGPRLPIVTEERSIVMSYYSLDGLHAALARAFGQLDGSEIRAQKVAAVDPLQIRVLVAEDNPVNQELIQDQLDILGYQADIVKDGLTALHYFARQHYDLVLTDLSMPNMDGYTLATCLRKQGAQLPIIAITAHSGVDERQRCEQAGISGVLLKPMSLAEIDHAVRKHLSRAVDPAVQLAIVAARNAEPSPLSEKLRSGLVNTTKESLSIAQDALSKGDLSTALDCIHSIKGAFAMLHQHAVVAACVRMEILGAEGKFKELAQALQQFLALVLGTLETPAPAPRKEPNFGNG